MSWLRSVVILQKIPTLGEDEGDQWSANQYADYWTDHLIQNWFEQDIKLGIVRKGCVVIVGKVGRFPENMVYIYISCDGDDDDKFNVFGAWIISMMSLW